MFYELILFKKSLKRYGVELGNYFEFGVYEGDSTIAFYNALKKLKIENSMKFYLFDSFVGLPDKDNPKDNNQNWSKGMFTVNGVDNFKKIIKEKGLDPNRLNLVDGFYEKSLKGLSIKAKPGIVNIDCDYYSSTVTVLNYLKDIVNQGTLIYFDDLNSFFGSPNKGMLSAIMEFNNNNKHIGYSPCPAFYGKYMNRIYWVWKD